jgi:hypothetical protein
LFLSINSSHYQLYFLSICQRTFIAFSYTCGE